MSIEIEDEDLLNSLDDFIGYIQETMEVIQEIYNTIMQMNSGVNLILLMWLDVKLMNLKIQINKLYIIWKWIEEEIEPDGLH